jgi:acyl-CoA thioesterase
MDFSDLMDMKMVFEGAELISIDKGEAVFTIKVNESDTNPYGFAHGGYLYTLCDDMAGVIGYSLGSYAVTLQANINYIKSAQVNDVLTVKGKSVHNGNTTIVTEVEIYDQNNDLLVKSQFTLFAVKSVE